MSEEVTEFVNKLITEVDKTVIIDADGLNAISKNPSVLLSLKSCSGNYTTSRRR